MDKDPNDQKNLWKKNEELLKKNQQQLKDLLVSFENALANFQSIALKIGLDIKHPDNPSLKSLPSEAIDILVKGLKKIPQLEPSFLNQAQSILGSIKESEILQKKESFSEKAIDDIDRIENEKVLKNVRFAKILKAAKIDSPKYRVDK